MLLKNKLISHEMELNNEYQSLGYDAKFCTKVAYISVGMIVILVGSFVLAPILINHFHFLECGETLDASNYADQVCNFTIVESLPEGLTYPKGTVIEPSIYDAWHEMIKNANRSIDVVSFYWTLHGPEDIPSAAQGRIIYDELSAALRRGVNLTIVTNAVDPLTSNETEMLKREGAVVHYLNMSDLGYGGIVHTKMILVDARHVYVGSANMDWRALTQNKEVGISVKSCSLFSNEAQKVVEVYKYLAVYRRVPKHWPCKFKTHYNLEHPIPLNINGDPTSVVLTVSPPGFAAPKRSTDLESIVALVEDARSHVYISVMDYAVSNLYSWPKRYWSVIDNALRKAAMNKHVEVRLMTAIWKHTKPSMINFMRSLSALSHTWKGVSVSTKLFCVPTYSQAQAQTPFSRVNHDKYMLSEKAAFISTSNWSEDYFIDTAGVSVLINQSASSSIRHHFERMFLRDWDSEYAFDVSLYDSSHVWQLCNSTSKEQQ